MAEITQRQECQAQTLSAAPNLSNSVRSSHHMAKGTTGESEGRDSVRSSHHMAKGTAGESEGRGTHRERLTVKMATKDAATVATP